MIGEPLPDRRQPISANLSAAFDANTRLTSSWSSARMFTQNLPADWILGQLLDALAGQNSTSGGSSDNEAKEPMAMPTGTPIAAETATRPPQGVEPQ